jgi:hypothetical protein
MTSDLKMEAVSPTSPQAVTTLETNIDIFIAVRTSKLTQAEIWEPFVDRY